MMKPALSNERMSREQCEPTTDVAKPNSTIPQNNPTRNFDFEQARMAIYFSDMRVRIRGPIDTLRCTLNLVGGGMRSRRRNNDNKERKKERTKKKYCKGWKEHTQKQNKNKQGRRKHNQLLTLFHSLSTP
jgi:hypothetical protein